MAPKKTTYDAVTVHTESVEEIVVTPELKEAPEAESIDAEAAKKEAAAKAFKAMRELVDVTPAAPRSGEDHNYHIGINGKTWLLPKGKTSKVPKYVAMAYEQAEAAKGIQNDTKAQLLKNSTGGGLDLASMTADQIAQLKKMLGL